jgi:hypothetical protein
LLRTRRPEASLAVVGLRISLREILGLRPGGSPHILGTMEELKSCLFCGRYVDKTFRYCPHCGYEFGQREDFADLVEDAAGEIPPCLIKAETEGAGRPSQASELPGGERMEPVRFYLSRLQDIERLLCDIEKELDLIILRGRDELPVKGPVTSSSKGP